MKNQTIKFLLGYISIIGIVVFFISSKSIDYSNLGARNEKVADSLVNLGYSYYNTSPITFINLLDSAAILYEKDDCKKKLAKCYQNLAFAYLEKLNEFDKAEEFSTKSILIWNEISDTLKEANMLKYLGLIQGKLGKFDLAKSNISNAIHKFELKKFKAGLAVSYYDLALVYEKEENYDSCIYFLKLNKEFFQTKKDTFRIFNANNKLLLNYTRINNFEVGEQLINSNLSFQKSSRVRWNQRLDFYEYSNKFYTKVKQEKLSFIYLNKYNALKDSLIVNGMYIE
jgi:tetratricopeptide (TPR) repeat protein